MNIVMVGPFGLSPKGTMRVRALPLAKALSASGHRLTVLIPPWDDPANSGVAWLEGGVWVVNVKLPPRIPVLFQLLLCCNLIRRILILRPDVVHFFKPKAFAGLTHSLLWCARRLGLVSGSVRLVVDEDDWERAWNDISPYSLLEKAFFRWQEMWGLRHADALTVASEYLRHLVQAEGISTHDIHYLPNGWRHAWGENRPARPEAVRMLWELEGAQVILLYTRFVEFRLDRIVNIVRLLAARSSNVRLLVVGEGLRGEELDLKKILTEVELDPFTVFAGWVPSDQMPDYFAAADLAIFPYDDTLVNRTKCSVRLVDMLAAGLPMVADAVGQNAIYIEDGVSGMLTPAEDDPAMVAAAVHLLGDADLRRRLGDGAAVRIRQHFDWGGLAQVAEKAYGLVGREGVD